MKKEIIEVGLTIALGIGAGLVATKASETGDSLQRSETGGISGAINDNRQPTWKSGETLLYERALQSERIIKDAGLPQR